MKTFSFIAVSCFSLFLFAPSPAFSSEICSTLGGTCRDACGENEAPETGAFEDCAETQQCCVTGRGGPGRILCCVFSFAAQNYGAANCGLPENNACPNGAGSPAPCAKLIFCK